MLDIITLWLHLLHTICVQRLLGSRYKKKQRNFSKWRYILNYNCAVRCILKIWSRFLLSWATTTVATVLGTLYLYMASRSVIALRAYLNTCMIQGGTAAASHLVNYVQTDVIVRSRSIANHQPSSFSWAKTTILFVRSRSPFGLCIQHFQSWHWRLRLQRNTKRSLFVPSYLLSFISSFGLFLYNGRRVVYAGPRGKPSKSASFAW